MYIVYVKEVEGVNIAPFILNSVENRRRCVAVGSCLKYCDSATATTSSISIKVGKTIYGIRRETPYDVNVKNMEPGFIRDITVY